MLMIQAAQRKLPNALFDWAQQAGCTFTQSPKDWKPSHPSNMTQAESPSALSQLPRSSSSCPHGPHTIRSRKPEALSRHISSLTWAGILGFRARRRASSSRVWLLLRWVPCTVFSLCCLRSIQKALVAQHKGLTKMQMLVFLSLCTTCSCRRKHRKICEGQPPTSLVVFSSMAFPPLESGNAADSAELQQRVHRFRI